MTRKRAYLLWSIILTAALAAPAAAVEERVEPAEQGAGIGESLPTGTCYARGARKGDARRARAQRRARRAGRSSGAERNGRRRSRRLPQRHDRSKPDRNRDDRGDVPKGQRRPSEPAEAEPTTPKPAAEDAEPTSSRDGDDADPPAQPKGGLRQSNRMDFDARIVKGETAGTGAVVLFERSQRPLPTLSSRRTEFLSPTIDTVFHGNVPAKRRESPKTTPRKQQGK